MDGTNYNLKYLAKNAAGDLKTVALGRIYNFEHLQFFGTSQADSILGFSQEDTLYGGAGRDTLLGREGDDQGIIGLSLVYAPLDDRTTAMPPHPYAGTIGLGADQMRYAWASYLGDAGTHDASPYAAPTRAENLGGLPPVFLAAGALDPVIEENLEFAQRLIREGVATTLHVFSGAPHGFDRLETAQVTAQLRSLRNDHLKRCIQP